MIVIVHVLNYRVHTVQVLVPTTPIRLIRVPLTNLSRVVIEVSERYRLALDALVILPL